MRFKTFGNPEYQAIIFIHGVAISWELFLPIIEYFSSTYYVVIPILEGHDVEERTHFSSIEESAREIVNYINTALKGEVFGIYGCSLGGSIAAVLLEIGGFKCKKMIIDAGPVVPLNKLILKLGIWQKKLQMKAVKENNKQIKKLYIKLYPSSIWELFYKTAQILTDETFNNAYQSVFGYEFRGQNTDKDIQIAYWYGQKEAFMCKKYAQHIKGLLPNIEVKVFKGCSHGDLVMGRPDQFCQEVEAFYYRKVIA